jgi:hypothetical protein
VQHDVDNVEQPRRITYNCPLNRVAKDYERAPKAELGPERCPVGSKPDSPEAAKIMNADIMLYDVNVIVREAI